MKCAQCVEQATLHITEAREHALYDELHLCETCGRQYLVRADAQPSPDTRLPGPHTQLDEYRLDVVRVIISELDAHQIVVFREVGGPRSFPLVIGIFEATSIDRRLRGEQSSRPLTHDAWFATIAALGSELQAVGIDRLEDHTFFASLRMARLGEAEIRVDIRPSDAVVMAFVARVPILIPNDLLVELAQ